VEEALLVAAGVLVDRGDLVLVDRHLRAAIGSPALCTRTGGRSSPS
jgi:hypothetical protein